MPDGQLMIVVVDGKEYITIKQAATILRTSRQWVHTLVQKKKRLISINPTGFMHLILLDSFKEYYSQAHKEVSTDEARDMVQGTQERADQGC